MATTTMHEEVIMKTTTATTLVDGNNNNNSNNDNDNDDDEETIMSAYFTLFSGLLATSLILSNLLHTKAPPSVSRFLPEAGLVLLIGIVAGYLVHVFLLVGDGDDVDGSSVRSDDNDDDDDYVVADRLLSFSPDQFFVVLLPPIIFNSGYSLRRELFFRHITPICLFAVIGTTVSAITIAAFLRTVTVLRYNNNDNADINANDATIFFPTWAELLTFGGLISATDPVSTLAVFQEKHVDPPLFYLVFGESVLNDAVGLVLFQAFARFVIMPYNNNNNTQQEQEEEQQEQYLNGYNEIDDDDDNTVVAAAGFVLEFLLDSIGSPILGIVCGCLAALLFKHVDMHHTPLSELSVYVLIMYVPYLIADMFNLSGIVTILFTGITARAYIVPNLSKETINHSEVLFRVAAHLAETSIFLELGLSVYGVLMSSGVGGSGSSSSIADNNNYSIDWPFIFWSLIACLLARAIHVYPITWFYNRQVRLVAQRQQQQEDDHHEGMLQQLEDDDDDDETLALAVASTAVAEAAVSNGRRRKSEDFSIATSLADESSSSPPLSPSSLEHVPPSPPPLPLPPLPPRHHQQQERKQSTTTQHYHPPSHHRHYNNNNNNTGVVVKNLLVFDRPASSPPSYGSIDTSNNGDDVDHDIDHSMTHDSTGDDDMLDGIHLVDECGVDSGLGGGGGILDTPMTTMTKGTTSTANTMMSDDTITPTQEQQHQEQQQQKQGQRDDLTIHKNTAHMLWFSGLRGAVAYACVRSFPKQPSSSSSSSSSLLSDNGDNNDHAHQFVVTTMVIVLITVFLLGSTTEYALNLLKIDMNVNEDRYMMDWYKEQRKQQQQRRRRRRCTPSKASSTIIVRLEEHVARRVVRCDRRRHYGGGGEQYSSMVLSNTQQSPSTKSVP